MKWSWPIVQTVVSTLLTGYRKPRQAIQAFCLRQANVPVGKNKRRGPRSPCSCEVGKLSSISVTSTRMWTEEPDIQIVTDQGDHYICPRRNIHLFINLSRDANNGFRKGEDIIFLGYTLQVNHTRMDSQDFLSEAGVSASASVKGRTDFRQTFPTASRYGIESKSFTVKSLLPLALIRSSVFTTSSRSLSWTWRFLASSQRPNVNCGTD
jgi:hypothetical protein